MHCDVHLSLMCCNACKGTSSNTQNTHFQVLELTCCPHSLLMSGNYDLHADEGLSIKGK